MHYGTRFACNFAGPEKREGGHSVHREIDNKALTAHINAKFHGACLAFSNIDDLI